MIYLRSLLFSIGMLLSMALFSVLGLLLFLLRFPFRFRYRVVVWWSCFTLWWLKAVCGVDWRLEGAGRIPPGPAIVFCKHQSTWETLAMQLIFPAQSWVLKRELMWLPLFGWTAATLKPIPIDRSAGRKAVRKIIDCGSERLRSGLWVVIFPEGTRLKPGETKRFGVGGALLASHSGYPVVPVAHNAGLVWPRRSFVKRPGTVTVVVGPLIESKGRSASEINAEAQRWIDATSARLVEGQQYRI